MCRNFTSSMSARRCMIFMLHTDPIFRLRASFGTHIWDSEVVLCKLSLYGDTWIVIYTFFSACITSNWVSWNVWRSYAALKDTRYMYRNAYVLPDGYNITPSVSLSKQWQSPLVLALEILLLASSSRPTIAFGVMHHFLFVCFSLATYKVSNWPSD